VVEIVLKGPGKNALSSAHMARLSAELNAAGGQPVLFAGDGDAFSAGLDLREVTSFDEAGMERFLTALDDFFLQVYSYPGPTVAAVNGHAIAGGCVLALCCDHRVVGSSPKLKMGLNEVALGLEFPPATLRICRERLARRSEVEVLLGAELFGPADALRTGLVDEIADDAVARGRAKLEALARHPKEGYAACKRALRAATFERRGDAEAIRKNLSAWVSPALKERLAAVLKK
jgi:enoyl-CoA hydratase